jgi:hypothetical protein
MIYSNTIYIFVQLKIQKNMKPKFLSKLMLVCFTAVMIVGCGGNNKKAISKIDSSDDTLPKANVIPPERCIVCNETDNYVIAYEDAKKLIIAFHNRILKNSSIANAGGFFTLNQIADDQYFKTDEFLKYESYKLHWAVEGNTKETDRLFLTVEEANNVCQDDNTYSGDLGIEGDKLFSVDKSNDILPFVEKKKDLDDKTLDAALKSEFKNFDRTKVRKEEKGVAETLLKNFRENADLYGLYQCDDIVFNKSLTWTPIIKASKHQSFIYFFGYDDSLTYHRLRLIIGSLDPTTNKIIFKDQTESLLRETSRPRP